MFYLLVCDFKFSQYYVSFFFVWYKGKKLGKKEKTIRIIQGIESSQHQQLRKREVLQEA